MIKPLVSQVKLYCLNEPVGATPCRWCNLTPTADLQIIEAVHENNSTTTSSVASQTSQPDALLMLTMRSASFSVDETLLMPGHRRTPKTEAKTRPV